MARIVYLNGAFLPEDEAHVGIDDGGWLHGAGLFETMRAANGRVFRLESHMERLRNSAAKLLRPIERNQLPSPDVFHRLLEQNRLSDARVRMTVTAGSMRLDPESEQDTAPLSVCVTVLPLIAYPSRMYDEGIGTIISRYRQSPHDPVAGHKTVSFLPRLLGLRQARQAQCLEALWFTTDNELAEGSISNVFLVRDGVLKTPPLETPVLPGVAREAVLQIARNEGLPVEETRLTIDDLLDADECFLTNVIMEIMPVIRVEKSDLGDGRVGSLTKRLGESFAALVQKECASS